MADPHSWSLIPKVRAACRLKKSEVPRRAAELVPKVPVGLRSDGAGYQKKVIMFHGWSTDPRKIR